MELDELIESLEDALESSDVDVILEITGEIEHDFPDFDLDGFLLEHGWVV
jgi:hypothetical protein